MTEKMTPEEALETIESLKQSNKKFKKREEDSLKNEFIAYVCVVVFVYFIGGFVLAKWVALGRGLGLAISFLTKKYGD